MPEPTAPETTAITGRALTAAAAGLLIAAVPGATAAAGPSPTSGSDGVAAATGGEDLREAAPRGGACRLVETAGTPPATVKLRATRRAQGASGTLLLRFAPSPYGVAVSPDGSFVHRLELTVEGLEPGPGQVLVAWVATPDLEEHERLGTVTPGTPLHGEVRWNKFLVFVTREASADVTSWSQEILLTARSPSSYMHSMAGHGPFSSEPCLNPAR